MAKSTTRRQTVAIVLLIVICWRITEQPFETETASTTGIDPIRTPAPTSAALQPLPRANASTNNLVRVNWLSNKHPQPTRSPRTAPQPKLNYTCVIPRGFNFRVDRNDTESAAASVSQMLKHGPEFRYVRDESSVVPLSDQFDCVVYTVLFGGYEKRVRPYHNQTLDCHWVVFTDQVSLVEPGRWVAHPIPNHLHATTRNFRSSVHRGLAVSKFVKMLPFLLFPEHIQFAIYIDGSHGIRRHVFAEQAINALGGSQAPIMLKRRRGCDSPLLDLHWISRRYKNVVGTFDIMVKYYLAHVEEGLCSWDAVLNISSAWTGAGPLRLMDEVVKTLSCVDVPNIVVGSREAASRIFFESDSSGPLRYVCRREPNRSTTLLPLMSEQLLRGVPRPSLEVPYYDTSLIGYRLNHPNATVREFSEEFLKQWHRESSLHGRDQVSLAMLLWRTPGFRPPVFVGNQYHWRGGWIEAFQHGS